MPAELKKKLTGKKLVKTCVVLNTTSYYISFMSESFIVGCIYGYWYIHLGWMCTLRKAFL